MNKFQLGKMYLIKQYFWLLCPMKELAEVTGPVVAYQNAKWYSKEYNCNVDVVEENTCFVLLEQDETYIKLLDSNGNVGWIRCYDFSKHFELVKE